MHTRRSKDCRDAFLQEEKKEEDAAFKRLRVRDQFFSSSDVWMNMSVNWLQTPGDVQLSAEKTEKTFVHCS